MMDAKENEDVSLPPSRMVVYRRRCPTPTANPGPRSLESRDHHRNKPGVRVAEFSRCQWLGT
jgi:hypothetical protein